MDYKEWIQNRAEELALEHYNLDYKYLPKALQETIFCMAERDYRGYCADELDATYERMREGMRGI